MSGCMREQEQFLQVLDRDEAERRFRAALDLTPRGAERIPLDMALGRVLAADVLAQKLPKLEQEESLRALMEKTLHTVQAAIAKGKLA